MPIVTPSSAFTFLDAVNRVLIANGIIRGDTDAISSFSDLQHSATVAIAQVAIQDELAELVADQALPYEHQSSGSITTVAGTRSYSLPSDFVRFYGEPLMYCTTDSNNIIYPYDGGEDRLRIVDTNYKTTQSTPIWFYFDDTTTKKVAFYYVPSAAKTYTFDYEASVAVANSTDSMPFHNNTESYAFCRLASRRFKMLFEEMDPAIIQADPERNMAKATLFNLIRGVNPSTRYAPLYR
jgi:hypothetical protein